MTAKYQREASDPDWVPLTPDIQTKKIASNHRTRLTGKASALHTKSKSLAATLLPKKSTKGKLHVRTRMKSKTPKARKPKAAISNVELKTLKASFCAHQTPKILKKRRITRKRMSLIKLIELSRVIHDLREGAWTSLKFAWMNAKRERSNTAIRRLDFSSPFAAHVVVQDESVQTMDLKESDEQCKNLQDHVVSYNGNTENRAAEFGDCILGAETGIHEHSSEFHTRSRSDKLIVYKRKGKRKDLIDFSKQKMDSDGPNQLDQNDNAAAVSNCEDLSSSFTALDPSVSEQNGCGGGNNCVILETQQVIVAEPPAGKSDESSPSSQVEEDLDSGNKANVMAAGFKVNVVAWVPLTPEIQSKLGHLEKDSSSSWSANNCDGFMSNNIASDCAKTGSNCGKSESFLDILKKKSTPNVDTNKKLRKRMKMKRHRPKVFDHSKPVKPSTPKPRTPKPARKVKKKVDPLKNDDGEEIPDSCRRKLDFNKEELKPQDRTDSSSEPPKICKKRRMMRHGLSHEKLTNLIRMVREWLPREYVSTIPDLNGIDLKMKRLKTSSFFATPVGVEEEFSEDVLVEISVEHCKYGAVSCNRNIQSCGKCGNCTHRVETKIPVHSLDLNVSVQQEELPCNVPCTCGTETKIPEHSLEFKTKNVLLIQDEAFKQALVDFAVQKMASLRLDDNVSKQLVVRDSNKFGAIVSSRRKTDPSKNHKAKVDLDPETMRVWDLLMGHNWSESTEAEGVDNVEYMKGQRILFRERIDLFLARMRVIQGDRRFSPWKGSVVDSIVGVFLTQNVSDHLSSSAFMALASTYPPLSVSEQNSQLARDDQQLQLGEPPSSSRVELDIENENESSSQPEATQGTKKGKGKEKQEKPINWDDLRKQYSHGIPIKRTDHNADTINWEAVRLSSAADLAKVIVDRGMNNQLAGRIKGFLDRLVADHGSIDLEWLRNVPPPKAKDYLLSISGLGLKSTECVRLLALHFRAFPVDTNAGRFFVRIGWVPLKPLPDSVHLHLLNQYPVLDSVQKYMWPRICDRDELTLYEFHCQSITVSKTFCTKTHPNCNECPMRGECRHYASALASSRLHLEGSQAKSASDSSTMSSQEAPMLTNFDGDQSREPYNSCSSEPIIEFPASPGPEQEPTEPLDGDIEDIGCDSEIPTITLNGTEFSEKIRSFIRDDDEISKALVAISPQVASIPMPKIKQAIRLRTVHQVYELPDSHHLLAEFENREPEDPCPYLLAIWTADETTNSFRDSDRVCSSQELTTADAGSSCSSREVAPYQKHEKVQGTILIPCRTANRGRFPLNGTYFQINEVFADHESSRQPIDVPRETIWNLRRRTLYCGTSITSICRGMSELEIAYCFQRSFICIRGIDTKIRAAKSLARRFHLCKSRQSDK